MKNDIYNPIEYAIRNHATDIIVKSGSTPQYIRNAVRWIMRNNPEIFWFAHQYCFDERTSTVFFQYTFSAERVRTIQQSIDDVVENDFCIKYVRGLSQQEQVAYVYKWLVTYCNYNANSAYNQSIYSVFVRRNSVCTGYAKAAHYLFKLLGIESRLVFGRLNNDKENGRYCWNIVKIDDLYYHFDACFGDSILDTVAKMAGVQELYKIGNINYNFFCVSTDDISKTRSIEDKDTLPQCNRSLYHNVIQSLAAIRVNERKNIQGCLLTHIGSSADIYLCLRDKTTVLKVFRPTGKTSSSEEYHYMQRTKGCLHLLQCNDLYTDIRNNSIAIEQSVPIVDLLCSHYYELSLKGLLKMATDIANAWIECRNRGVLYRDIHICNIYRADDGTFKLGDFGSCTENFRAKEVVGNQWFMAPETFVHGIFTEASAIYSISMVMYFILNKLRPAYWIQGCADEALRKRMNGEELPLPVTCRSIPGATQKRISTFFKYAIAFIPGNRISRMNEYIPALERLSEDLQNEDLVIHKKGISPELNFEAESDVQKKDYLNYIPRDAYHLLARGEETERKCCSVCSEQEVDYDSLPEESSALWDDDEGVRADADDVDEYVDDVDNFARTMASNPNQWLQGPVFFTRKSVFQKVETDDCCAFELKPKDTTTYQPVYTSQPKVSAQYSFWSRLFGKKKVDDVYSSIFAPAEIKRKSHLLVQVYLHLYEESYKVEALASESDKNAERRDYTPLQVKLKQGDKVNVELNIYGETRLMNARKSVIWQGSFTKCSFDYFVSEDVDTDELSCEVILYINGALIGEMRFITQIVNAPRNLNPEILSRTFKKIFISYAHQDIRWVKNFALAYKAQGVDYFFDRDRLKAGDVYEEKIFEYIDTSDLFILCWSKNAAQSDYVAKEKGRALLRAYPQLSCKDATLKIYPISIKPRAELPDDMKEVYNFEVV